MIFVPHHGDPDAFDAGVKRAIYYGGLGAMDPRTYTLDLYFASRVGMTMRTSLGTSMSIAILFPAIGGFVAADPLNHTPGYGVGPDSMPDMLDLSFYQV